MLDHPHLLRNDVELLGYFDADLDQHRAVVGADPLGFRQFMTDDLARQRRIERLAPALLARVRQNLALRQRLFGGQRPGRRQGFGFVEEQILLLGSACFRFGVEQLAQEGVELLLQKVALDGDGL